MSVFEDLIDELKSENLLESSDINVQNAAAVSVPAGSAARVAIGQVPVTVAVADFSVHTTADNDPDSEEVASGETEFFLNRASEEVSSLLLVEHVLSGVEREAMNRVPSSYDYLNVKTCLHIFQQVSGDAKSPEHVEAEFALRQETQAWAFALHERDQEIPLPELRRFCDDSQPALSSQALIALARFYRNSPYSEAVRTKFDFAMTRLFTREAGDATRKPLFSARETVGHIDTLYKKWSSIALYSAVDDEHKIAAARSKLDGFSSEVKAADSFDTLLRCDLFGRVRACKEELAEIFFVPEVVAASIYCNLEVNNRFAELIAIEVEKGNAESLQARYSDAYDESVSEAIGTTTKLSELLTREFEDLTGESETPNDPAAVSAPASPAPVKVPVAKRERGRAIEVPGVNRWLLAICVACILVGAGVYVWAEKFAAGSDLPETVSSAVQLDDPDLKKYVRSPRASRDTFYAITQPAFDSSAEDEKKEVLGKLQKFANSQNYAKVNLVNTAGQTVAFASKERFELIK